MGGCECVHVKVHQGADVVAVLTGVARKDRRLDKNRSRHKRRGGREEHLLGRRLRFALRRVGVAEKAGAHADLQIRALHAQGDLVEPDRLAWLAKVLEDGV